MKFYTKTSVIILTFMLFITVSYLNQSNFYNSVHASGKVNEKEHWVLLICGGAHQNETILEELFSADAAPFQNSTRHAYDTFRQLGYDDEHILYLYHGNRTCEGSDAYVSSSMVKYGIEDWMATHADENDDCCICFFGHGGKELIGVFNEFDEGEMILSQNFSDWINTINCGSLTILLDTCHAGSFINELSGKNRIIMTSSTERFFSASLSQECAFSYHFFNKLAEDVSYGEAWEYADKGILFLQNPEIPNYKLFDRITTILFLLLHNPQIDDNGDGIGSGRNLFADSLPINGDGDLALNIYP